MFVEPPADGLQTDHSFVSAHLEERRSAVKVTVECPGKGSENVERPLLGVPKISDPSRLVMRTRSMQNMLGAPRYLLARPTWPGVDEEKEAASMLEDHEGLEVMDMEQMRLCIVVSQSVLSLQGFYGAVKHVPKAGSLKACLVTAREKGVGLRGYVLAERALYRDSIFHYCIAPCGWEAYNKMQIEDCPSMEDQLRLSVEAKSQEHTAIQFPQMTRPQHCNRRSCSVGFSVFSSYCGEMIDKSVAQVQHASSIIMRGYTERLK